MAVLIKGMKMPVGADELRLIIRSNGQVIVSQKTYYEETEAVELPPHGRLIDADLLPWFLANKQFKCATYEDWEKLCDAIATAPTIIEKEGI